MAGISIVGFIPEREDSVVKSIYDKVSQTLYICSMYILLSFLERSSLGYNFLLRHNQEKSAEKVI